MLFVTGCGNYTSQKLLLSGGGYTPDVAMEKFQQWSGGRDAHILVVTWSTAFPIETFDHYQERFSDTRVTASVTYDEINERKSEFLQQLYSATGVFFTGGDQNRVFDILDAHPDIGDALRAAYYAGIPMGGTSAGCAIMSPIALTGEVSTAPATGQPTSKSASEQLSVGLRPGLGLLRDAIVDQHFLARKRLGRLRAALRQTDYSFGIGVDEDTAFSVENGRVGTVLGGNKVVLLHGADRVEILNAGARYDLVNRRVLH